MLKSNENLKIMGEALFWQFRFMDVMAEIRSGCVPPEEAKPLVSCTEIFLLDVSNQILALSKNPRQVLRQLPWYRRMLSYYPKVGKVVRVMSSPVLRKEISGYELSEPSVMSVIYELQHPAEPGTEEKHYEELLTLLSDFFQHFGSGIFISGLGNPAREEEFARVAEIIRSMENGTYVLPEEDSLLN